MFVKGSFGYLACIDATGSFPERMWSLPLQQARFPDFRLKRIASRPSQPRVEISDIDGSYAIAGTQWREPSGHFTQLPLSPLMGTCDGPTRRRRVELAIAWLTKNRFQLLTRRHSMPAHICVSSLGRG